MIGSGITFSGASPLCADRIHWMRGPDSLDAQQFHVEDEGGIGRDDARMTA